MKTVVGLYDELEDAREAVDELVEAGVPRSDISLVARDVTGEYGSYLDTHDESEDVGEAAASGAVGGAVVGGLMGLLVGLGAFAIPGIGPVIAAGPVAAALAGAGIGAATGGVLGALVEWGIPEDEAGYYAEGVRRGGTLLAVRVAENQVDDVVEIMNDYDPVNIEERAEYWRSEYGWERYDPAAEPYAAEDIAAYRSSLSHWDTGYDYGEGMDRDDLLDEEYSLSELDMEDESLYSSADRRPSQIRAYGGSDEGPTQGHVRPQGQGSEGDVTSDVIGRVKPREQGYTGDVTSDVRGHVKPRDQSYDDPTGEVMGQVRPSASDRPLEEGHDGHDTPAWADLESVYRRNYDTMYATTGRYSWNQYSPAYRYGYNLATDRQYAGRGWAEVESDARRHWEMENEGTWQEFKEAVRYGWEQVQDALGIGGFDAGVDDLSDESMHRR